MSDDPKSPVDKSDSNSGNGGEQRYPQLVGDGLEPDPDEPNRYIYDPVEKEETRKRFFTFSEIVDSATSVEWLVKGFLETNSLGVFYGDTSSYKTFVVLDIGLCVAYGKPWHGNQVKQGTVVYVCGEGESGLARRLMGWKGEFAKDKPRPDESFYITSEFDFCSVEDTLELKTHIDKHCSIPPSLIIVDTLARNFGIEDENNTKDMNKFVTNLKVFLQRPYEANLSIIHHVGHGDKQRARGASTLRGALDFEYRLERHNDSVEVHNSKMKDGPPPKSIMLDSFSVDTCYADDDGVTLTSLALQLNEDGPPEKGIKPSRLGENQKNAIEVFDECFKEMELNCLQDNREPKDHVIKSVWQEACAKAGINRKRFYDVKSTLVKNDVIEIRDKHFVHKGVNWSYKRPV